MCVVSQFVFFFKQKTAYEMRISDWSSDVCSSDLGVAAIHDAAHAAGLEMPDQDPIGILVERKVGVTRERRHGNNRTGKIGRSDGSSLHDITCYCERCAGR